MIDLLRAVLARKFDPASRLLMGELVMFTGIAAVFPVAPLYVRQHGGGAVAIALFIAGPMVANTLAQIPAGHLVDRVGRKPLLIGSTVIFAVLSFGLFLNIGPLWVLALYRCGQGFVGGAYVPALRSALADLTTPERRGERYSQLQAIEMVGLLIGPAIGGALALWTYSAIYLCSGLGSILATLALLRLPETKPAVLETAETAETPPRWWMSRGILVPCFCLMAAGMLFSMYDVVWPQYLASRGVGPFLIGLSISIFALPVLLLATTAGRFSDRANRRLLVACAFVIVASTAALYPELHSYPVILLVGLFEALGFMIVEPSLFAVLSECASTDIRGRAMGLGGFFQFGGGAFGAGFLGSLFGLSEGLPFWAGACFAVLAAAVSALWMPARRLKTGSPESLPQIQAMELEIQI